MSVTQLILQSHQPSHSSICPLFLEKVTLTVRDKHQPNKTQASRDRQNFFFLSPCSHDLFVHWGDSGISCFTRPSCVISPLHHQLLVSLYPHIIKNSMWSTAVAALHLSHEGMHGYKQASRQEKIRAAVSGMGSPIPWLLLMLCLRPSLSQLL